MIVQLFLTPSAFAVIIAVPGFWAVTTPKLSTFATLLLLLVHVALVLEETLAVSVSF